jgi:hypothetical protein
MRTCLLRSHASMTRTKKERKEEQAISSPTANEVPSSRSGSRRTKTVESTSFCMQGKRDRISLIFAIIVIHYIYIFICTYVCDICMYVHMFAIYVYVRSNPPVSVEEDRERGRKGGVRYIYIYVCVYRYIYVYVRSNPPACLCGIHMGNCEWAV